jgi:hypothetical protein
MSEQQRLIESVLRGECPSWPGTADAPGDVFEDEVLQLATAGGVAALLANANAVRAWPVRVRNGLIGTLRRDAAAEVIRRRDLRRLLDALADGGVRALLFKGAHLAYRHYEHPWLRPRLDTDVMIASGDRRRADEVLQALGYQPTTHFGGELVSHQFQYQRVDRYGVVDHVDLHWKIANPHVFAEALSFEELNGEAVPLPPLGVNARGVSNPHALILACVHLVAHHRNSARLIWLHDIHLLARALRPDEWQPFVDVVLGKQLGSVCSRAIGQAMTSFETAVPATSVARLRNASSEDEPAAAFLRGRGTKLAVLRSDLRALPSWGSKVGIVREHLFPPAAYMRTAYGISSPAVLPLAYAFRIARGFGRWTRPRQP